MARARRPSVNDYEIDEFMANIAKSIAKVLSDKKSRSERGRGKGGD